MKSIDDIVFITHARLSSARLPNKMIKPFAGTTLIDIAIENIKKSSVIPMSNFYFSAYEPEILKICYKHGVNVFYRSKQSARCDGIVMQEIYEWWDKLPYRYFVLIHATTPFLTIQTIDNFSKYFMETASDGLFAVKERKNFFWKRNQQMISSYPAEWKILNTKVVEPILEQGGCLYAGRMDLIGENIFMGDWQTAPPELYVVDEKETLDIDEDWEFNMCEQLYSIGGF